MTKAMTDRLRDRINLVLVDWRVRVFELYVLIDRPSDCLYVLTITIFGYMEFSKMLVKIICETLLEKFTYLFI